MINTTNQFKTKLLHRDLKKDIFLIFKATNYMFQFIQGFLSFRCNSREIAHFGIQLVFYQPLVVVDFSVNIIAVSPAMGSNCQDQQEQLMEFLYWKLDTFLMQSRMPYDLFLEVHQAITYTFITHFCYIINKQMWVGLMFELQKV